MSRPSLSRPDRVLLGVLLSGAILVSLGTWLLEPPEKTGGIFQQPSTFYNAGYGTKAAFEVLSRLQFDVARLRRPIVPETLEGVGTLVVLRPMLELGSHELDALKDWVAEGHALIVVPGSSLVFDRDEKHRRRGNTPLEKWFKLMDSDADPQKQNGGSGEKGHRDADPDFDTRDPLLAGIANLTVSDEQRFDRKSPLRGALAKTDAHVFWKDKRGTIGLRVKLGDGLIIALADSFPLSNVGLGQSDNGLLLVNMAKELSQQYQGAITFDEYHLGFRASDWSSLAMIKLILAGPWRWAILQAVLISLLGLYAAAIRFGTPKDVIRRSRRQHREFAESAGRLLHESGATTIAAETLYRYYRDRLCGLLTVEPEADDQRLDDRLRHRCGPEDAAALHDAKSVVAAPVGHYRLFTVFRKLHHVVEKLEHGT